MDQRKTPASVDRIAANRLAWNAVANVHARTQFDRLASSFANPSYVSLDATEQTLLNEIGVDGKRVAQLCCNNARELISVLRLGAQRGVGFDQSEAFVDQGRRLVRIAGADVSLECCDVLSIDARFDGHFDLVYVTIGSITWMPECGPFFRVVKRLLAAGGALLLYDMHPVLWQYEEPDGTLANPYFDVVPYRSDEGLDYFAGIEYDAPESYCHQHTLGDLVTEAVRAGLVIDSLREYDHDISNMHSYMDSWSARPPRSFSLIARAG